MSEPSVLRQQLQSVLEALERIPPRFDAIKGPEDFSHTPAGVDRLDAICMVLIAVGEAFKKIDRNTFGQLLVRYPEIDWAGVKGVRDVIAHGYFDTDAEEIFDICKNDVPKLIETVRRMIKDMNPELP